MRVLILAALVFVASAKPAMNLAPLLGEEDCEDNIKDQYIVVFKEEASTRDVESHRDLVKNLLLNTSNSDDKILSHYSIGKDFRGYSAIMDERMVDVVRAMSEVKYVERNQVVRALQTQCNLQNGATWGLVRTTLRDWNTNPNDPPNEYEHDKEEGQGVEVYIIDTGIDATHPRFEGRANRGVDFVDNPPPSNGDPNGHGTHVAGTVMADTYGLARSTTAIGVRVLNAGGSGSFEGVIAGINYVADQKRQNPSKKIVGNMSLGGGASAALNDATNACVQAGVHMAVAAGNENTDACSRSPASADQAFTAAASDTTDTRPSFSNYGTCVDIIAPGVNILSTTPNGGTASFSGTSMSSPHVAGVIAKVLAKTNMYDAPAAMKTHLKSTIDKYDLEHNKKFTNQLATKGKITGFPTFPPTDNDLLFFDCE